MKFWFSKSETPPPAPEPKPEPAAPKQEAKPPETKPPEPPPPPPAAPQPEAKPPEPPAAQQAPQADATPAQQAAAPSEATPPAPAPAPQASSQQLYRNLMDALYDSVLLVDEKGYVVDCNRRVEHTFGYSQSEMWDMPLHKLVKGFGPIVLAKLAEPLSQGRPVIISGRGIRKSGSLFDAEISASKVKLLRSETLLFAVRDITGRLSAMKEKVLAQAQVAAPVRHAGPMRVVRCAPKTPEPEPAHT